MSYLLDTNWLADFLAGRQPAIDLVQVLLQDGIAISIITYLEIVEGILGSRDPETAGNDFRRLLEGIEVIGVSEAVADRTAATRLELRRKKSAIEHRSLDLLIAATAIEYDLSLVTRNVRDYQDIVGLRLHSSQ